MTVLKYSVECCRKLYMHNLFDNYVHLSLIRSCYGIFLYNLNTSFLFSIKALRKSTSNSQQYTTLTFNCNRTIVIIDGRFNHHVVKLKFDIRSAFRCNSTWEASKRNICACYNLINDHDHPKTNVV